MSPSPFSPANKLTDEVLTLIKAEGRKALGLPGDVKTEEWCKALVQQTVDAFAPARVIGWWQAIDTNTMASFSVRSIPQSGGAAEAAIAS